MIILSAQLKRILFKRGLKIAGLSRQTGVPIQTLHNWLSGCAPRRIEQVKQVADFLGVSLDELLFGVNPKGFKDYEDDIQAGIYEVVLRRIGK